MLDLIIQNMSVVWLVLMVLLFIIEAATAGLTVIWFALGALAALIAALFGAQIWLQVLWFTRPLALKYLNGRSVATNADRVVGMEGVVCEDIDNLAGTGAVKLDGKEWTARSDSGANIPSGSVVKVRRIEGVKLIVDAAG